MARSSQQLAAIMLALRRRGSINKLGGLRETINRLKSVNYKPQDYKTLHHTTLLSNWYGIKQKGLQQRFTNRNKGITQLMRAPKDTRGIYGASRHAAKNYYSDLKDSIKNIDAWRRSKHEVEITKPLNKSLLKKYNKIIHQFENLKRQKEKVILLKFKTPRSGIVERNDLGFKEYLITKDIPSYMVRRSRYSKIRRVNK